MTDFMEESPNGGYTYPTLETLNKERGLKGMSPITREEIHEIYRQADRKNNGE